MSTGCDKKNSSDIMSKTSLHCVASSTATTTYGQLPLAAVSGYSRPQSALEGSRTRKGVDHEPTDAIDLTIFFALTRLAK